MKNKIVKIVVLIVLLLGARAGILFLPPGYMYTKQIMEVKSDGTYSCDTVMGLSKLPLSSFISHDEGTEHFELEGRHYVAIHSVDAFDFSESIGENKTWLNQTSYREDILWNPNMSLEQVTKVTFLKPRGWYDCIEIVFPEGVSVETNSVEGVYVEGNVLKCMLSKIEGEDPVTVSYTVSDLPQSLWEVTHV